MKIIVIILFGVLLNSFAIAKSCPGPNPGNPDSVRGLLNFDGRTINIDYNNIPQRFWKKVLNRCKPGQLCIASGLTGHCDDICGARSEFKALDHVEGIGR